MTDIAQTMAQATRTFQSGDFARARDIAQSVADRHPANAKVLQFLGIAQAQAGDAARGFATLKRAIGLAPGDAQLRLNTARAAIDAGAYGEVAEICKPIAGSPAARQAVAQAARLAGDAKVAVDELAALATQSPRDVQILNNYGNALVDAGRAADAVGVLRQAFAVDPAQPQIWFNLGRAHSQLGEFDNALSAFDRAVALEPEDSTLNLELGKSLLRYGRYEQALQLLAKAARGGRPDADVITLIGLCYAGMENRAEAERAYHMALKVDPTNTRAILNLVLQMERENRMGEIRKLVEAAKAKGLAGDEMAYCDALILRREGDIAGALEIVEAHEPEGLDAFVRSQLIGQLADQLGDATRAFAAFSAMNEAAGHKPDALAHKGTEYSALVRQRTAVMTPQWFAGWKSRPLSDARPSPAFLGGFLRSGTTLLDTILMGHNETEVREEQPMLAGLEEAAPALGALPEARSAQVAAMRGAYFTELRANGPVPEGKLVIDKYPLMTLRAAFIHRVFPDAKFIFALRHPCDVVLSCWMQNFRVTQAMASFLTLENAARFYDAAMGHWERARAVMPLDVHTVRYEDMVLDLEAELRPLIAFLGLEWDDALLNHQKTAKDRGYIRTPSYAQVTEGVYTRSSGRWEAYRAHMEPVLPILAPWIEKFGYELV